MAPQHRPGFSSRCAAPEGGHRFPCFLPDGKHFLFFVSEARAVFLGSLDGSPTRQLLDADAAAVFAPPSDVVFVRDGVQG